MPCQPKSFRRSSSHHYGAAAHRTCGWRPFLAWILPTLGDTKTNPAFALLKKDQPAAETAKVAGSHGKGDSPAQAADKSTPAQPKSGAAK
jgi:hypothetical protein